MVARRLKRYGDVALEVVDVRPGTSTPFHGHPHAHESVVVAGAGALRLGEATLPLAPGDTFSVAPHQGHAIESRGSGPLRFVCLDCLLP